MSILSLDSVVAKNNSVSFKSDEEYIIYEILSNTIHIGEAHEINDISNIAESMLYYPKYESHTLKKNKNANFESLLLNITESCNLNCEYCIYSGKYIGERKHSTNNMNIQIASKAVDLFVPHSKNDDILIGFYGGEPLGMNAYFYMHNIGTLEKPGKTPPLTIQRYIYEAKESIKVSMCEDIEEIHIVVGCRHERPLKYLLNNQLILEEYKKI